MTELQISLISVGGAIVLGVMIYNRWQLWRSRRNRPVQPEQALPAQREGGNFDRSSLERREPSLGAQLAETEADANSATALEGVDATLGQPADATATAAANTAAPAAPAKHGDHSANNLLWSVTHGASIDPIIDCVVSLRADAPFSSEKILPFAALLRRAGNKPVLIEGLNQATQNWEPIRAGQIYADLQVAVQLANRNGPLNALEFSEFVGGVQRFADALDAEADFPDMNETVGNARELDAFALLCDAQLGVNIISDGAPWSAAYVQTIATQDGLVLSRDGTRFTRFFTPPASGQNAAGLPIANVNQGVSPIFTLQFAQTNFLRDDLTLSAGHQIVLNLDVPCAEEDIRPFRQMCDYAHSLASRMGAKVVDDNQQPLPEEALKAIEKQLMALYSKLEARGIPAGSAAALRLFSH